MTCVRDMSESREESLCVFAKCVFGGARTKGLKGVMIDNDVDNSIDSR